MSRREPSTHVWNPVALEDLVEGETYRAWTTGRQFKVASTDPAMLDYVETPTDGYTRTDGTRQGSRRFDGPSRPPRPGERQDMVVGHELGSNWAGGQGPLTLLDPAHLVTEADWEAHHGGT